ncbi:hypothetical protein L195_g019077 [Trifolium pratense]|uniref:Uncharacterized protein n=1 Tax=Trifolium pratense TaxID=57577 RepID=A0A2K3MYJ9_TRIPR|nr:hypothetical protein L195_g019077 [Trifolium pratense]
MDDYAEQESMDKEENLKALEGEGEDIIGESQRVPTVSNQKAKNKHTNGGTHTRKGEGMGDRTVKELKLATRGSSFKGKSNAHGKRGVESIVEKVGVEVLENILGHSQQPKCNNFSNNEEGSGTKSNILDSTSEGILGTKSVSNPNVPRPPNWRETPPHFPSQSTMKDVDEQVWEGEVFVDAHDQGTNGNSDSEMEIVTETISLS